MARRVMAALGAVVFGAGAVVCAEPVTVGADPQVAVGEPGSGPCRTDPAPTHEPLVPETLEVPIPYPVITVLPPQRPDPEPTRVEMELPSNPCTDPCPDLTDEAAEPPSLANQLGIPEILLSPKPFHFAIPGPGPDPGPGPPPPLAVEPVVEAAAQTPAPSTPRVGAVREVAKQTGASSVNRTDKRWQVQGTDLGIMWESAPGEIATAFGDTVGRGFHPPGGMGGDWRSNVLAFSTDRQLGDGMTYDRMVTDSRCHAAEVLSSRKLDNVEVTTIPTSGFALGDRQYMSYMSIRTWNSLPGTFFTNYGGIAYSDDHGQTWTKDPHARWENIFGLANFQVSAMVPHGEHVYVFGTPNTRLGAVGLARVPKDQVLNTTAYQYWRDGSWTPVGGAASATPVLNGPAGELSVRYDAEREVWQMSYLDTAKAAIVVREANSPQGVWSEGTPTVTVRDYPELYGGFIHPWSSGSDLYFNITTWSDYNVYLMHATLE
ncbi:DUF4185 domain-containing protein [Nocardia cyriacigeorgica]|uniref:DUF4185 domain-containing protein n=1 Tax=Nocardia cyriacigeorgica TaxID=135487 RepID=A0ABX0CR17_9NOCA|nr:DUF4185 domain-containing protein [Nocardia cyriacigeorgica]NEW58561.1 DUF4185 domain-containing protein [Nocardia cyriacigeorgica]